MARNVLESSILFNSADIANFCFKCSQLNSMSTRQMSKYLCFKFFLGIYRLKMRKVRCLLSNSAEIGAICEIHNKNAKTNNVSQFVYNKNRAKSYFKNAEHKSLFAIGVVNFKAIESKKDTKAKYK